MWPKVTFVRDAVTASRGLRAQVIEGVTKTGKPHYRTEPGAWVVFDKDADRGLPWSVLPRRILSYHTSAEEAGAEYARLRAESGT